MSISQTWEIFILLRKHSKLVDRASQFRDEDVQALLEQEQVSIIGYVAAEDEVRKVERIISCIPVRTSLLPNE
jgi:hypothetical protein